MTDLNKALRSKLRDLLSLSCISQKQLQESKDEETTKFLWELSDGKLVESVLICSKERRTVCVS
jgi:23S rRNA (adenine2503-C2)-methyltransferase